MLRKWQLRLQKQFGIYIYKTMIRIDFIGPPGSGKTTIINEILAQNAIKNSLKLSEARAQVVDKFFSKKIKSKNQYFKSFIIKKILKKNYSTHSKRKLNKFFGEVIEEYDSLIQQIFKNLTKAETDSAYLKSKRLGWFIQILEDTLLVSKYPDNKKIVLCEESLSSKILQSDFGLTNLDINDKLKESLMPSAFVHVCCNKELLNKRLLIRKKLALQHSILGVDYKEAIKESIRESDIVSDKLQKLGIPCLRINSRMILKTTYLS